MTEREIFLAVLDLPDAAARAAYLKSACGDDAARRAKVEALLQAHNDAGSFLAEPAVSSPQSDRAATAAFPATPDADAAQTIGGTTGDEDEALGFLTPPQRPDSLGRIGHYEVLEVLGRGGFGIVFRAHDEVLQRVVAVKVLAPGMAATSPARKRFLREARSSAQIRHENVVQVYAVEEQPLPYLVMEFIPGETLQQRLDRTGPLEALETLRIGRQIAEGLAAAHAQGLIHRDVKPANVLIEGGAGQRVKLTDFGLARAADDASISQSGIVAGTPMYMAPEQAKGETLDHRADLFSLGSVMYAMLTGHPPFRATTTLAVLKRVTEDDPRPIREVIPEVPEWLCRIVEKLHAKDPAARFQSAREVADVLSDCETQLAAHPSLKDYSRIPAKKPAPRRYVRLAIGLWLVATLFWGLLLFGESAFRYLTNRVMVEIVPQAGLTSVIVLQNGMTVHDWMDLRTAPQSLSLPAGQYQMNMGLAPGYDYEQSGWVVEKHGLFGSSKLSMPGSSVQLTVDRGESVTIRAVPKISPTTADRSGPPAVSLNGNWDSNQGLVTLQHGPFGQWTVIGLSGFYAVDKEKTGVMTRGSYNLENRTIEFSADEPWRKGSRAALLKLSPDGNKLEGGWRNSSGESGTWTLIRRPSDTGKPQLIANGQEIPGWGTAVNPLGDCKFSDANGRLAITVPGAGNHNLNPTQGFNLNAPRILRDVQGDFEATVTVLPFVPPQSPVSTGPSQPYVGAGLVVWQDDTHFLRLFRSWMPSTGAHVSPEWYSGDERGPTVTGSIPDQPTYLRIRRERESLRFAASIDGQKWTELTTTTKLSLSNRVRVGVAVVNSIEQDFTARFEGFIVHPIASAEIQSLREVVAAKERSLKMVETHLAAGHAAAGEQVAARIELIDARVQLAEAEGDRATAHAQLKDLVASREEERRIISVLVEAGTASREELNRADVRVAEAKARLAKAPSDAFGPAAQMPSAVAPFDAKKAKELQEAWATRLGVPVDFSNSIGVKFRLIPPGEFTMGSSPAEVDWLLKNTDYKSAPPWVQDGVRSEAPDRHVTVREPFYLGTYGVTVGQFREFVRATGYKTEAEINGCGSVWSIDANDWVRKPEYVWTNPQFSGSESHPVVFITPRDARAFCEWLSQKDGRHFEIPTEEQWEWACRAGTTTRWFFGDGPARMKEFGWTLPQSTGLNHPVGRLAPNPFGLYDIYGNAINLAVTPQGGYVDRGGEAGISAWRGRSASRYDVVHPDQTNFRRGFRVAIVGDLTPKPATADAPKAAP